jgi:hypothetical protein
VVFSLSTTNSTLANDTCPSLNNAVVSGTTPVTETLTIDTNAANCLATGAARKRQGQVIHAAGFGSAIGGPIAAGCIFAGLLLAGIFGWYSRKLRVLTGIILLATAGIAFTGCGGSSNTVSNAPKGSYTLTLTGQDSSTGTIQASTTFTLTID